MCENHWANLGIAIPGILQKPSISYICNIKTKYNRLNIREYKVAEGYWQFPDISHLCVLAYGKIKGTSGPMLRFHPYCSVVVLNDFFAYGQSDPRA